MENRDETSALDSKIFSFFLIGKHTFSPHWNLNWVPLTNPSSLYHLSRNSRAPWIAKYWDLTHDVQIHIGQRLICLEIFIRFDLDGVQKLV